MGSGAAKGYHETLLCGRIGTAESVQRHEGSTRGRAWSILRRQGSFPRMLTRLLTTSLGLACKQLAAPAAVDDVAWVAAQPPVR